MAKQFNSRRVFNFVLVDRELAVKGGLTAFRSYTDHAGALGDPGRGVMYVTGKDQDGRPLAKYFEMNHQHYNFTVREGDKDLNGISMFEFLSYAPQCAGSPNGTYIGEGEDRKQIGIVFKLMDTDKDAELALEAGIRKTKAEASALAVDEETLKDLAAHIGHFGEPGDLMRIKVYQWAGKRPVDYFEVLNSGDRALRAIVRKALEQKIFTRKGPMIMWESELIGSNEDEAVARLSREKAIVEALQNRLSELHTDIQIKGTPGPKKVAAK